MSPQETSRKIRQLDNEVGSIYQILSGIEMTQKRHSLRFEEQAQKLDGLEARLDGLETRFDGLETRFDGLETKVDLLATDMGTVLEILRSR